MIFSLLKYLILQLLKVISPSWKSHWVISYCLHFIASLFAYYGRLIVDFLSSHQAVLFMVERVGSEP